MNGNQTNLAKTEGDVYENDFIRVEFQSGFPSEVGINGCRVDDVIEVAIMKLDEYQRGALACVENEQALRLLVAAKEALHTRMQRRKAQGVLNTMEPHQNIRTEDVEEDFSATGA